MSCMHVCGAIYALTARIYRIPGISSLQRLQPGGGSLELACKRIQPFREALPVLSPSHC